MPHQLSSSQTHDTVHFGAPINAEQETTLGSPKISMNSITTYRWSLDEDVTYYREFGYRAIGLWRQKLVGFGEERAAELLRDSGMQVSSLSWIGGFTGANQYAFRDALHDGRDAIDQAAALNAETLVAVSGPRAGHTTNHARRLLTTALKQLAPLAADRDVKIALLPMHRAFAGGRTFLNTLDQTLEVIHGVGHPALGIAFDVYHLWREPRLMERIPEIAPYVSIVQLSDWREPVRSEYDRHLPGQGMIPLVEIINSFTQAGFTGYFDIHVWSERLWSSDYAALLDECRVSMPALCPA